MTMRSAQEFGLELKRLSRKAGELKWIQFTTGLDCGVNEASEAVNRFMADAENYRFVREALEAVSDPLERRRFEIAERAFRPFHLSPQVRELNRRIDETRNRLADVLNKFRPEFEGRRATAVEIQKVLSDSPDRARRRAAFESRKPLNGELVKAGFLELVELRNALAQACGFESFIHFSLDAQDLPLDFFDGWPQQVEGLRSHVSGLEARLAQKHLGDSRIHEWDTAFVSTQVDPTGNHPIDPLKIQKRTEAFFRSFGIDIAPFNITFDLFPRRNKSEWGYNFPIAPQEDTRILMNVSGRFRDYGTMLHETAHAIHSYFKSRDDHWLNMGISGIVTEGYANCFGYLAKDPEIARELAPDLSESQLGEMQGAKDFSLVSILKKTLVNTLFDHALYQRVPKTQKELNEAYWDVWLRVTGQEPWSDEPVWGPTIHFTTHPIYYHNYFLGDLMAESLKKVFLRKTGRARILEDRKAFSDFLLESIIKPLGELPLMDLLEKLTGERRFDFSDLYVAGKRE